MMTSRLISFWMSQVGGWTYARHKKLLGEFVSEENIYAQFLTARGRIEAVLGAEAYAAAKALRSESELTARLDALTARKINVIDPSDECFPSGVANLSYDRPFVLYYAGDKTVFCNRGIAVVGTRKCSFYGEKMTKLFAGELARSGLNVVSGLAEGIDGYAHRAALDVGGTTIAVLGSGLKVVTPSVHIGLARSIAKNGGLVVSDYLPDQNGTKYTYPHRNRLIAALSDGVLLVEAGERSGALYTVNHALQQNKSLFLVPANLDSPSSRGVFPLMRQFCTSLVTEPDQILEELGLPLKNQKVIEKPHQLDILSQKILDMLGRCALNYDSLFESAAISHQELNNLLLQMELIGLIESRGSLYYLK